jgi:integrase
MANKKVALVWYGKDKSGKWSRTPAIIAKNGRVSPNKGFTGHFELRYYEGRTLKYQNVGTDGADALAACIRKTKLLAVKDSAQEVGVRIVEEEGRTRLTTALDRFVEAAEDKGSHEAAEVYRRAGEAFIAATGRMYTDEVTAADMSVFHKALRKRKLSDRTISNRHKLAVSFLRFAGVSADAIPKSAPKYESSLPTVYTAEQTKAFFAFLTTDHHRITFSLALQCGLREQELMHVYWTDIDFTRKTLLVRSKPEWGFAIKDKEERSIPLSDSLLAKLKEYKETSTGKQLVTGTSGNKPNTKLLRTLKRLVHAAGLNCGVCKPCTGRNECEQWFLHKFRSTFCTRLLQSGMDLRSVMQLSGHSDIESVMRYLRPAEGDELRARVNAIAWSA